MRILVAGGTGFIGPALVRVLGEKGHEVSVLVRNVTASAGLFPRDVKILVWDGRSPGDWCRAMEKTDAAINLAGASVGDGRWTKRQKALILQSRVEPTRAIVRALHEAQSPPRVLINASAVGYYGMSGEGIVTEDTGPGTDFLAQSCVRWEAEALQARGPNVRVVPMRCGVVLAEGGGVLDRMLLPFKLYIGGPLGSGRQWYPWVHRDDFIGAILHVLSNHDVDGPVNVVAPEAVTMGDFARELGRALRRPSWMPVPSFVLELLFGEMAGIILEGRRIEPSKLTATSYTFHYPALREALEAILS